MFKPLLTILFISLAVSSAIAQPAEEIITDFNGFWQSTTTAPNAVRPNNHHHLLAFTVDGYRYSTGVNDSQLDAQRIDYQPATFQAASLAIAPSSYGSTFIGMGSMADGLDRSGSNSLTLEEKEFYLTNGTNGLDLGTAIANPARGQFAFDLQDINPLAIGDGVPDVLISQVASPSRNKKEYFHFTDAAGNRVGATLTLRWDRYQALGSWKADFFKVTDHKPSSHVNTARDIRLYALDLSQLGVTAQNYQSITALNVAASGSSDPAFVAYNNESFFNGATFLPVEWKYFRANNHPTAVELEWATLNESGADYFSVERSENGANWTEIGRATAAGNSSDEQYYSYTDYEANIPANRYYRLREVDFDGSFQFSTIIRVIGDGKAKQELRVYPTVAQNQLTLEGAPITNYQIVDTGSGQTVLYGVTTGAIQQLDVSTLTNGQYLVLLDSAEPSQVPLRFFVQR